MVITGRKNIPTVCYPRFRSLMVRDLYSQINLSA